jgi:hypothetical protein
MNTKSLDQDEIEMISALNNEARRSSMKKVNVVEIKTTDINRIVDGG